MTEDEKKEQVVRQGLTLSKKMLIQLTGEDFNIAVLNVAVTDMVAKTCMLTAMARDKDEPKAFDERALEHHAAMGKLTKDLLNADLEQGTLAKIMRTMDGNPHMGSALESILRTAFANANKS